MDFLAEVSSPHISSLTLPFPPSKKGPDVLPNFAPLAASLTRGNLACLNEVRFVYDGAPQYAIVLEKIRSELPEAHAHGLVHLVIEYPPTWQVM